MDLLGSEWDWQTAEISAYHFLFPSACAQADTLEHLFIDLMHDLCNRIAVLKRQAYLQKRKHFQWERHTLAASTPRVPFSH